MKTSVSPLPNHLTFTFFSLLVVMGFLSFVKIGTGEIMADEIVISDAGTQYLYEFENLAAASSDSVFLTIDASSIMIPSNEVFTASLLISMDDEDRHESLKLSLNGDSIGYDHVQNISGIVGFGDSYTFKLLVENEDEVENLEDLNFTFVMTIDLEEFSGVCPMLPDGIALMEFNLTGSDGENLSKITYDFASEDLPQDSAKLGDVYLEMYSYSVDKVLSQAWFDFVCTPDGAIFSGAEMGWMPLNQSSYAVIDMDIAFNNNYIPNYPQPGTNLDDARVSLVSDVIATLPEPLDMEFNFEITMDTEVTNRKVIGIESITTPAGTFNAYRLEFDTDAEMDFTSDDMSGLVLRLIKRGLNRVSESKSVVWYVRGIGLIRQETTNRDGTSILELTRLVR